MRRAIVAGAAVAVALVGCGSDDDGATTDPSATAATTTDAAPISDPVATDPPTTDAPAATDPPATDPPATDPPATDPPTTDPPPESYIEAAGLATIELLPTEAGEQPVLAWTPVDGAVSYRLAALTSDGSPYWAWLGEATEVRFGGAPEAGGQTAIVFEPMTWRVIALDADGVPTAASEPGELTP
jgi:hypothetical protein